MLGAPLAPGWFVSGSVSVSGPSGHAHLSIPLAGTRRPGTLHATATKTAGMWRFDVLQLAAAARPERIDLLAPGRKRCD